MIQSFRDRDTRRFFESHRMATFQGFAAQAERRLTFRDSAETLRDLSALPSNWLEILRGDRSGQRGIRVHTQLCVCFRWTDDGSCDVNIVDHH